MQSLTLRGGCVLVTCLTAVAVAAAPPAPTATPRALLHEIAAISDREWAAIEHGAPVVRTLSTNSREVAVAGAVRINADRARLIARLRSIDTLKRSAVVLDAATFSAQPGAADLARLSLEEHSLDLRDCRPGDCRVRLTAEDIARFHRDVNWNAPDWRARSADVWRHVLAAHAAAYQKHGRSALPTYTNKTDSLSVSSELDILLSHYSFLRAWSPSFLRYMQGFGPGVPAGAASTLYWSKEDFGIRPIVRISHQVIQPAAHGNDPALVVTNQVYADHYLDAALTVTMAVAAGDDSGAFYMISVNRARTRSLGGWLRAIVRSAVHSRTRDAMQKILTATKTALEREKHDG